MKTILLKLLPLLIVMVGLGTVKSQTITTTAGSITSCPGEIQVPVNVTECNGIGAISLMLYYDTTKLTYLGYQNLNAALTNGFLIINQAGNKIVISWINTTAANLGNTTLVQLRFNAITSTTNLNWDTQTSGNCEYTDVNGNIKAATYTNGTVTINQIPAVNSQPTDKTILLGQNTNFSVGAIGNGLTYIWQLSTNGGGSWTDLTNNSTYSGVSTATLGITNAQTAITGYKFKCKITGTCTPVVYSNVATLTVINPITTTLPTANFCPGNITVPVTVTNFNGVAAFSLSFSYNPAVLNYTGFQTVNPALSGGNFIINAIGGRILMTWSSTTAVSFGNGTLVELLFSATTGSTGLSWDVSIDGSCEYSNLGGTIITPVFVNGSENIYTIPSVTAHPVNKIIAKGQNTSFAISSSGTGLSHIWQVSTNNGVSFTDLGNTSIYSNVTGTTLYITNAQLSMNNYQFRCKVSGTCLPVVYSNPALLTVLPNIITTCGSSTICPGQIIIPINVTDFIGVASFSHVINFNPAVLTYTGFQNLNTALSSGNIIANAANGKVFITWTNTAEATIASGGLLLELKFTAVPGSSSLTYDTQTYGNCEYVDLSGQLIFSTWNNGSVTINSPPLVLSNPENKSIYASGSTSFSISASGTGAGYQWQVSSNNGISWANASGPYTGTNTSTLTVNPAATGMNNYLYRCIVSGSCTPTDTSATARLTVTQIPITTTIQGISNSCTGNLNIPVNVINCNNVGGISLTITYDTTLLSFEGYQSINAALNSGIMVVNRSGNKVYFTWASTTPANIGSATLFQYRFRANTAISTSLSWDTQTNGSCEYTDSDGNTIPAFFTNANISVVSGTLVVNAGNDTTIAPGGSTLLNASVSGGAAPVTYTWSPATGLNNASILNPVASPAATTTYTLTANGNNGCSGSDAMTVFVVSTPGPAGTITGSTTVCQGQNNVIYSVPLISNATSYVWTLPTGASGTSASNSITVNYGNAAVSGNITVKGHNSSGDGSVSSLAITVNLLPNANAGNDLVVCSGNTVTLVATGGTSYQWNNGITQNTPFIPENTSNYIVLVTNQFNCTKSDTVLVTVKNKLLIVNALLEGLHANGNLMNNALNENSEPQWGTNIADKVTLEIRNASAPYAIIESVNANLLTNSEIKSYINCNNEGLYYIAIKHRNHLETWSADPVSFANDTVSYNFTIAASQAFADNQKEVATGIFAIMVGDINQDGVVDLSDLVYMDNDLTNGTVAYVVTDLNGDGVVDLSDLVTIDENITNGVVVITP